tara:strand:+ start:5845 stop:7179 length:1335 start_codon:yes stop_codon:yes gene_type:complete
LPLKTANKLSKSQIRKLGDRLRKNIQIPDDKDLIQLEEYRTSFKSVIPNIFKRVYELSRKVRHDATTTYRIKRIESILSKLQRFDGSKLEKIELDRMWDIVGCRVILNTEEKVYQLFELLKKEFEIRRVKDYYNESDPHGYTSLHVYVSFKENPSQVVEIQIRTKDSHNWATLVEIVDLLFDKNIKEGEEEKEFIKFHLRLSKLEKIEPEIKREVIDFVHEHKIFSTLMDTFSSNYLKLRLKWLKSVKSNKEHFFIIEASKDKTPNILAFEEFKEAEQVYFDKFYTKEYENTVMTFLPQANFDNLERAYSNYTLTTHQFTDTYIQLCQEVLYSYLSDRQFLKYHKLYNLFAKNLIRHIYNLKEEVKTINEYTPATSEEKRKVKFWKKEFSKRIKLRFNSLEESDKVLRQLEPENFGSKLYLTFLMRITMAKTRRFSRKLERSKP